MRRHAVVFGGTGAIGSAVVEALREANVQTTFTYFENEERAFAIARTTSATPARLDLLTSSSISSFVSSLTPAADVFIHCAALPTANVEDDAFDRAVAITGRAAL